MFDLTINALNEYGKASAQVAVAIATEWPKRDDGTRSKDWFGDNMSPAIKAAGHVLSYNSARLFAAVVDTLGDEFDSMVATYGWSQVNEAVRGGNTGNIDGARNVLATANRDAEGNPIVDDNGNAIVATVDMVKATASDLSTKPKTKRNKPLTVFGLSQADMRKHDTDALNEYRGKLQEQIKRVDNVLRTREESTEQAA